MSAEQAMIIVPVIGGGEVTVHAVPADYARCTHEVTPDGRARVTIDAPAHLFRTVHADTLSDAIADLAREP